MIRKISTPLAVLLSLILFIIIAVFVKGVGSLEEIQLLFTAESFIFGVAIVFFLTSRTRRLEELSNTFNEDNANLIVIYKLSGAFGRQVQTKIRGLLDNYLISQLDYFIEDYKYTRKKFEELVRHIIELKPRNTAEHSIYANLLELVHESYANRLKVIALVRDRLFTYEWFVAVSLAALMLLSIFYGNSGSLISIIFSVLLSTAIVTIVLVLAELDLLTWKEETWNWGAINETFMDLGLLPYYPEEVIKQGRALLPKGQKVRIATYRKQYPQVDDKSIRVKVMK